MTMTLEELSSHVEAKLAERSSGVRSFGAN